jgi:hypothetical protein
VGHPLSSLPAITYPFVSRIHAEADLAEAHVRYFGRRFGFCASEAACARFDAAGFGVFGARTCPDVGDVELMAEWAAWLFVFDDEFDEAAEPAHRVAQLTPVLGEIRRILSPSLDFQGQTSNPYTTTLADMWPRTARLMSRGWRKRFARNLTAYVEIYADELSNRRYADPPAFEEYLPFRRVVSAVDVCWDMIEVGLGRSLPEAVVDSAACQELRLAANDITCWTNDLVSFNKEHARGDANNLVSVLAHANGLSFDEAAEQAASMIDTRVGDFVRHQQTLPILAPQLGWERPARDLLTRCTDAMATWMAGSLAWHTWSGRYRHVEYTETPRDPSYYLPLL